MMMMTMMLMMMVKVMVMTMMVMIEDCWVISRPERVPTNALIVEG